MKATLKIVVIGGSGLIGSQLVKNLTALGHEVVAASPSKGVNTITGEGLAEALAGADVVVDVANSPSFEDQAVLSFFETAGENIARAEAAAGVKHHLALSVVGTDRLPESGYFRAKLAQEKKIKASGIPYTILRATQFHEFVPAIAQAGSPDGKTTLSSAMMQPVFSGDVAAALTRLAIAPPADNIIELAGPEKIRMDELVRRWFAARGEKHEVLTDDTAGYFGTPVDDRSLTPDDDPLIGSKTFNQWLSESQQH